MSEDFTSCHSQEQRIMYKQLIVDPKIRAKHTEIIESPQVVLVRNFTEDAVKEFREQMEKAHQTGQPIIPIVIDSYGGSVYGCLDMIGHVQKATLPVYTIISGKAMSAGAILFSAGERRYMAENATIMIHDASSFVCGKTEEVKSDAKELERLNNIIFKLMAKNTGQTENYFIDIVHQKGHADWYLNTKDAKKHKLCTHVGIPKLTVKISVDYSFEN
jgi:ATP-dependent Clp protease protease subunit